MIMNTYLLYEDKEWSNTNRYFDYKSITQDLGLEALFSSASKEVIYENESVQKVTDSDLFLYETMKNVMIVPLRTKEEIRYRQAVLKDCLANEDFIISLYQMSNRVLMEWKKLGRKSNEKAKRDTPAGLMTEIKILGLFVKSLSDIKILFSKYQWNLKSKAFIEFQSRLNENFSDETEKQLKKILQDISFFEDGTQKEDVNMINKPRIVFECGIAQGLKLDAIKLEEVSTKEVKYRGANNPITRVQKFLNAMTPDSTASQGSRAMEEQITELEFSVASYIVASCTSFLSQFGSFFDQLHVQTAFYRGAVNLQHHMKRFDTDTCFPDVSEQDTLLFTDLREIVMCMEQRKDAVGNDCKLHEKMLVVVTGANQGGKSTFLRSIGIAQVLMQCGLMVAATSYMSGIFPSFFTHFTRREDSAMNSGRLDEELNRMNQIIDNLGENSLVLLNESFATTTEKEGSVIAYDIIKALIEANVKVLTVTHLLSFAQKVYNETLSNEHSIAVFFSAERLDDGTRTFKMIQHAPELTSFGLDLYDDIITNGEED